MASKKAFTLIELLIVVAIIGILATVTILNVTQARTKAEEGVAIHNAAEIKKNAEIQMISTGVKPNFFDSTKKLSEILMSMKDESGASIYPAVPEWVAEAEANDSATFNITTRGLSLSAQACTKYNCGTRTNTLFYQRLAKMSDTMDFICIKIVTNDAQPQVVYRDDCVTHKFGDAIPM